MKLVEVLLGEPEQKEFEVGNHKIVLRTLKQVEINEVISRLPRADLTMLELEKVPTLARSIVSIDGINPVGFDEIRVQVEKDKSINITSLIEEILSQMDSTVINVLFSMYSELREEAQKRKADLKKTSLKK
jgi:hypothetical protein